MEVQKTLSINFIRFTCALIVGMAIPSLMYAQLSGTYTIGGGGDYASISAAVADLDASGVSGAVTFNISSGTYTEQVTIPAISGASSSNTITFRSATGNAANVTWQFNGANTGVIILESTGFLRFEDLTITNTNNASGRVFSAVSTGVSDLIIQNSILTAPSVIYLQNIAGGDIQVLSNEINGGSYGIFLTGTNPNPLTGVQISGNTMSVNSYGVNGSYLPGVEITNNKIYATGTYGIYLGNSDSNPGAPAVIINNYLRAYYALTFSNSDNADVYHNNMEGNANGYTFYATSSGGIDFRNNNVQASNAGYVLYVANTGLANANYNNYYSKGARFYYSGTNYGSLADYQAGEGIEGNSIEADPQYVSESDLTSNSPALSGAGVNLGISQDINGNSRFNPPSIGANEIDPSSFSPLSGTYSIGGGGDYSSISDAYDDLRTNGISGPVVFEIATGVYNEQVTFGGIAFSSSTNTVTFTSATGNAEDVDWEFNGPSDAVIWLDGTAHLRFQHITIRNTFTSTSYGIRSDNSKIDDIEIEDCIIDAGANGFYGIYFVNYTGDRLRILSNEFPNSVYGTYLTGRTNNLPSDIQVSGNRFLSGSNAIFCTYTPGIIITNNRISVSSTYGIYLNQSDSDPGSPVQIINNHVRANYPVWVNNTDNVDIFHNNFDSQTSAYNYVVNSQGVDFRNNNISASYNGYAIYSQNSTFAALDYNNYFTRGARFYYNGTTYNTLSAFQSGSGLDGNSLEADPQYVSENNLTSLSPALAGAGVSISGVNTDIDGISRFTPPSIGANEIDPASFNPLSGTYSIGGGGDYATITDAYDALRANGVGGPVVFEIASGTYTEQLSFGGIAFTTTANTVTFTSASGNASDVNWEHNGSNDAVIWLDGSSHLRFESMTIRNTFNSTSYGFRSDNSKLVDIQVEDCILTSGGNNLYGIYFINFTGDGLRILSNEMPDGGIYGTYLTGQVNNLPANIELVGNRYISGSNAIFCTYTPGIMIMNNRVSVSSTYGIYLNASDSDPGSPAQIINNHVRANYPVWINNSDNVDIFHNNFDIISSTYNYLVNSQGIDFRNNAIRASFNGYAIYVQNTTFSNADYNNYFDRGARFYYDGTTYDNFSDYQAGSGLDANSITSDPQFISNDDLTSESPALSQAGVAVGVGTDIDGNSRFSPPSIGANEIDPSSFTPLSGTYSVGSGQDYSTITDAYEAARSNGVGGPVIFEIVNGTYNEQIKMGGIAFTSSTNTVTFRSASGVAANVTWQSDTQSEGVLEFDGSSYLRFENLNFDQTNASTAYGIRINQTNIMDIVIQGCLFTSTGNNTYGLFGQSMTGSDLVVTENEFLTRYGIYMTGYNQVPMRQVSIEDNVIDVITYGIYLSYFPGTNITANRILSSSNYGLYLVNSDSDPGDPIFVVNNYIGTAGQYAIYISNTDNINLYHNNIFNSGNFYGLSIINSAGVNVVNNNIKASQYLMQIGGTAPATSNYNNFFSDSDFFINYLGSNYTTLGDYQSVSGLDGNSLNIDPLYESDVNLKASANGLIGAGTFLASVPNDINDRSRNDPPDIGANNIIDALIINMIGTLSLQGRPAAPHSSYSIPIDVTIYPVGSTTPVAQESFTTDNEGDFQWDDLGVEEGDYTITIKNSHTLIMGQVETLLSGGNSITFAELKEGDADDNNVVTILDFSILAQAFSTAQGDAAFNPAADFNESNNVSIEDFSLLSMNFNQFGFDINNPGGRIDGSNYMYGEPVAYTWATMPKPQAVRMELSRRNASEASVMVYAGSQRFDAIETHLSYDPSAIRVLDIEVSDRLPMTLLSEIDPVNGRIHLASGAISDLPSGELEAFRIIYERLPGSVNAGLAFVKDDPKLNAATFGGQLIPTELAEDDFGLDCIDCPDGLNVYPNGSTGRFNLYLSPEVNPTGMLRLSGVKGEMILEIDLRSEAMPEFIDITSAPKGVYILQLETDAGMLMKKLLKY